MVSLFKKGSRVNLGNHRLVSLSIVGKILKNILRERIKDHLENQGLIRNNQYGMGQRQILPEQFDCTLSRRIRVVDVVFNSSSKTIEWVPNGKLWQ